MPDPTIKVNLKAHQSFIPFAPTNTSTDHSVYSGVFGVTETVNHIKDRLVITTNFDGSIYTGITGAIAGHRAGGEGFGDDPGFRWLTWITGYSGGMTLNNNWVYRVNAALVGATPGAPNGNGMNSNYDWGWDRWNEDTNIREWYIWGARKFHMHMPFGKVVYGSILVNNGLPHQESLMYQPDAYSCARHGFVNPLPLVPGETEGMTGNLPMPWVTEDIVDGVTAGFVPLFKALTSGLQGDLSNDMWQRLTGIGGPSAWFDPNDPIEITSYTGCVNDETRIRWRQLYEYPGIVPGTNDTGPVYARKRLEESSEVFARAGIRLGYDALVSAPGPIVGINGVSSLNSFRDTDINGNSYKPDNLATGTYGNTLDAAWWSFFTEYSIPRFGKQNIFQEAIPGLAYRRSDNMWVANPYIGHPVLTADEYGRAGFGGSSSSVLPSSSWRQHHLAELGEVEFRRANMWGLSPHMGKLDTNTGLTALDGDYWSIPQEFAIIGAYDGGGQIRSGLPPIAANELYLRAGGGVPGYDGYIFWAGTLIVEHLLNQQVHLNNPFPLAADKTKAMLMISNRTKRLLPSPYLINGITQDFNRRYPTITDLAKEMITIRNSQAPKDPTKLNAGATANIIDIGSLASDYSSVVRNMSTTDHIDGVMWLKTADYDTFTGNSNLTGVSGGAFWTPITSTTTTGYSHTDIDQTKFYDFMDMKYRAWVDRFGTTPKYIAWKLSEYNVAAETGPSYNRQPIGFEMERYLFLPKTIPTTVTETPSAYSTRLEYFASVPGITWGTGQNSEQFVNNGYDIARSGSPTADSKYTAAKDAAINMITLAKSWRTNRGVNAKVGVYNLPYLPKSAYNVYAISGSNASSRAVVSNTGNWNDRVFAKQSTTYPFGINGWYTEAETETIKKAVKLEYRKRLESVSAVCEVLFASMYNSSSEETIAIDPTIEANKQWHMEVLELGNDLKTKQQWNTINNSGSATNLTCELQTLVDISVVDPELSDFPSTFTPVDGDPFTKSQGTLFNHEQVEYNLIDWVRDDYLRPKHRGTQRIQGMSIESDDLYRANNAIKTANYTGKTADRDWIVKWIVAEDGAGATINWSNTSDVNTKIRRFFAIRNNLVKRYLDRFNKGVPRKSIHDPYTFSPFAACWNKGFSGPTFGYYPSPINGQAITDVVPMIWASSQVADDGIGFIGGFRSPGNTGNMPSVQFARFSQMANRVPLGKRVMLPWYWQIESPSGQVIGADFYKAGSDGCTYYGSKYRAYETPGSVKFISLWADNNTQDSKSSFTAFLAQCGASGTVFDQIANDFEGFYHLGLGSPQNTFENPFGPTGMPAGLTNIGGRIAVVPWNNYEIIPDNRATQSIVTDPRFSSQVLPLTGLTFGGSVEKYYYETKPFAEQMRLGTLTTQDDGLTAQKILAYYIIEGPTGISAATGPNSCTSYYVSGAVTSQNEYTPVSGYPTISGWRPPWGNPEMYHFGGNVYASIKRAWFAWNKALNDLVFGGHMKRIWLDTLQDSTIQQHRNISYNHYGYSSVGVTEGALIMEANTHPQVYDTNFPLSATGADIGVAPVLYGEANSTVRAAGYYPNPTTDSQRYTLALFGPQGSIAFGGTAKAYISLINELTKLRAILRSSPNSWKKLSPWLKSPEDEWFMAGFYVGDDSPSDPSARSYEVEYLQELAFHTLLSGAQYINYFNPGRGPNSVQSTSNSTGFTAGITFMQGVFDTWKVQAESCRVQPASNETGDVDALMERILLSDAGGNHVGCTGTVTSGGKLLKYVSGKTGSVAFGGENNDTYLWRISVPPQAVGGTYARVNYPSAAAVADLPAIVIIPPNETGFWIKRKANSYKPVYRFSPNATIPEEVRSNLVDGAGFDAANPNKMFTDGNADTKIGVGDVSDIRVIAAWRGDPIPFDTSTETTVTICAYHPSGINRVEASLNGGLTANLKGDIARPLYEEFTFTIPNGLPDTTDFPSGDLHEIRAKIYPNLGLPRILGGGQSDVSRYYTATTSLASVQPTKLEANETSYFLCKETPSVVAVSPLLANSMTDHTYKTLRDAILFEMGDATEGLDNYEGSGKDITPYNKKFVRFSLLPVTPTSGVTHGLPIQGDPLTFSDFYIGPRNSPNFVYANFVQLATEDWRTKSKAIVIEKNQTAAYDPLINAVTVLGDTNPPPRPAGFILTTPGAAAPYPVSGTNDSRYTINSLAAYPTLNAYCTFNGNIYRLNRKESDIGTGVDGQGEPDGRFVPNALGDLVPPTGSATDNEDWIFESSVASYETNILLARSVKAFGISKIKFKNVIMDRGSILEFTNASVLCDGVTFMSSLQPPTEQSVLSFFAPSSFTGCVSTDTRYGLNGARRINNCTINSPYSDTLANASFVYGVGITGAGAKDVIKQTHINRTDFKRKNSMVMNASIHGTDATNINLEIGGGIISGAVGACADHEGLLFKNISVIAPIAAKISRINGNAHQVFFDGVSFGNQLEALDNTYKVVDDGIDDSSLIPFGGKAQKVYLRNSTVNNLRAEDANNNPFTVFGSIPLPSGNTLGVGQLFALNTNYCTKFGISADNVTSIVTKPTLNNAEVFIRGIPWQPSNTTTPSQLSLYVRGLGASALPTQVIGSEILWSGTGLTPSESTVFNLPTNVSAGIYLTCGVTLNTFYGQRYIVAGITTETRTTTGATYYVNPVSYGSGVWNVTRDSMNANHWIRTGAGTSIAPLSWVTNVGDGIKVRIRGPFSTTTPELDKGEVLIGPITGSGNATRANFVTQWNAANGGIGTLMLGGITFQLGTAALSNEAASTVKIAIKWGSGFGASAGLDIWPGNTAHFPDFSSAAWKIIPPVGSLVIAE